MAGQSLLNGLQLDTLEWPAMVKFFADPELAYARNAIECTQHLAGADDRVMVIDSAGLVFKTGGSAPQAVDLAELGHWVREHAMVLDQCCVAKIHLRDTADAMAFVAQLEDAQ